MSADGKVPPLMLKQGVDAARVESAYRMAHSLRRRGLHGQELVDRLAVSYPINVAVEAARTTSPRAVVVQPKRGKLDVVRRWWGGVSVDAKVFVAIVVVAAVVIALVEGVA